MDDTHCVGEETKAQRRQRYAHSTQVGSAGAALELKSNCPKATLLLC